MLRKALTLGMVFILALSLLAVSMITCFTYDAEAHGGHICTHPVHGTHHLGEDPGGDWDCGDLFSWLFGSERSMPAYLQITTLNDHSSPYRMNTRLAKNIPQTIDGVLALVVFREMFANYGYEEGMKRIAAKDPGLAKQIQQFLERKNNPI